MHKDPAPPHAAAGQPDHRKWLILLTVGIGTFMSALDGSVVNTILPVLRSVFHSDVSTIQWVVLVYLLVVSGLLLTFGRLGDMVGNRPLYLSGFFIFLAGSALSGMAQTAGWLVAFRGLQALGGAMLYSNGPAILTKSFPAAQRGQALGVQATMTYVGLTVGPSLGGFLAQAISWRSVFYINVPVCLVLIVIAWIYVPREHQARAERFDVAGALLFMAGLVSLLIALNRGGQIGWGSPLILGLIAAAVLLLAGFVWVERRQRAPMLDFSLFGAPVFSAAMISAILNYIALYAVVFLLPFYLIQGCGLGSSQAGLILTAQPIIMAIVAPLSGTFSDRIGSRIPATLGMWILAGGLFMLSRIGAATPLGWVMAGLAVCGLGTGIFVSPNNSALMGAAPRSRQGIASGILATARNLGMVLGIGVSGAILSAFTARSAEQGLFQAVQVGFVVAAGVALAASVVSLTRGKA